MSSFPLCSLTSPTLSFFYCFTPITSHRLNYRPSSLAWQAESIPKIKTFLTEIVRGKRGRQEKWAKGRERTGEFAELGRGKEKEGKGKGSWHIQCLFYFLFSHFSRMECEDLTLSIRPLDKFNHDVPSAKSRLNRNANNRALGPLINGNQED